MSFLKTLGQLLVKGGAGSLVRRRIVFRREPSVSAVSGTGLKPVENRVCSRGLRRGPKGEIDRKVVVDGRRLELPTSALRTGRRRAMLAGI
jgi:hypothetical protein